MEGGDISRVLWHVAVNLLNRPDHLVILSIFTLRLGKVSGNMV